MKTSILAMAALAMFFAACTSEDEEQIIENGDEKTLDNPVAVDFSAGIATRVSGNQWEAGDAVGISVTDGADGNYTNVKYTVAENGASATFNVAEGESPICYTSENSMSFSAYYPYAEESEMSGGKILRNTTQAQDKVDFLWATKENKAYEENPQVTFSFQHKMAQINVEITSEASNDISGKTVVISGLKHDGSFNTQTGIAAPEPNAQPEDWTIGTANTQGFTYTGLIYPQNANNITLKVGDESDNLKATLNLGSIGKFDAGFKYTLKATVKDGKINTQITIDGNTIEDWKDGTIAEIAFIGITDNINELTEEAKAAAKWLQDNVANSKYISVNSIANAAEDLSNYKMIWMHFDWTKENGNDNDNAINTINDKIKSYYENGGNILASRDALRFVGTWNITADARPSNNNWGGDASNSLSGNQGFYCNDKSHAIFNGLNIGDDNMLYLRGAGLFSTDRVMQWGMFDDYSDLASWKTATGGIQLGADGNDPNTTIRVAEFPSRNNSGKTIVVGDPSFEWNGSVGNGNSCYDNLNQFTKNIISYLTTNR